jgi:exodeoxyribonuclease VII large subunit
LRLDPHYQLERLQQRLDDTSALLQARMQHILSLRTERLRGVALRLHSLSPLLTIARGYAVVRRDSDRAVVSSTQQVRSGDELTIQVTDGHIRAQVKEGKIESKIL